MNNVLLSGVLGVFFLTGINLADASEKLEAEFTTSKRCQAYSSIRKQSNPVALDKGKTYRVVAKNKRAATHYRIIVPNSRSQNNWVSIDCGRLVSGSADSVAPTPQSKSGKQDYLLALSWQPGFCLTHGNKRECQSATSQSYSARHLSLHGLWPQPRNNAYCGVSNSDRSIDRRGRWDLLKPLVLSEKTKQALQVAMPGYASLLQRHEWIKHGTCYSETAEQYYVDSVHLTSQVNTSAVDELLASNKGKKVTLAAIRQALEPSVGKQAAARVALRCGRRNQITELWIGLRGNVQTTPLRQLMEQGETPSSNCQSGQVSRY